VIYTDVDRQGGGIVEFANKADQVALRARAPFDHCLTRVRHGGARSGQGAVRGSCRSRS
jgi:hypothetical protein